jgi:CheY-like chemotaxis protein
MNAGPGRPSGGSGGGGGRRRRRGRRPSNQRGQRPGPGLSRENKDGIYTAPMDHSYRAAMAGGNNNNGHKGGRPRPGFQAQYPQPDPEPLPAITEDTNSRIFAFIEDLFFMAKIQETARKLNVKVEFVKSDKDLMEKMSQNGDEKPSLIIFDLNLASVKPLTLIPKLKNKLKKGTSIIGFLSHVQGDLKQKAHEVGCDMVLPRSAFSQNLPQLLRRHGAPEDVEPTVQ